VISEGIIIGLQRSSAKIAGKSEVAREEVYSEELMENYNDPI